MSYYDFRENKGFYRDNTREIIKEEVRAIKSDYKKTLIIFILIAVLANALTIYLIRQDMIKNLTSEIRYELVTTLKQEMKDEVLQDYRREYYLPENYSAIGVAVASKTINSILELSCASPGVASKATAIILNKEGYIITNAHVITYEKRGVLGGRTVHSSIKGNFHNSNTQYPLEVVDYDTARDLAILKFKIAPAGLSPIIFADSNMISLGEECVVIGNAEGMGVSLTTGCVSNTPRNYEGTQVIQTDAAINPGNSGGPIFNVYGELIGVATFKIVASEASEGMGFGITSNEAVKYIKKVNLLKGLNIAYTLAE